LLCSNWNAVAECFLSVENGWIVADSSHSQEIPEGDSAPGEESPPETSDAIEREANGEFDYIVPSRGSETLRIVGLGGSAGSLHALQEFFSGMPDEPGLAFVVIVHLSPDHESTMADLLQRSTRMPVHQVNGTVKVELNEVYVIPPGKTLTAVDGYLRLSELAARRGRHVAVDVFFRSLADTHGLHAAAVVLSGADGDGALGIKSIKECGGLTIAQDPSEAEYESMPRAAVFADHSRRVRRAAPGLADQRHEFLSGPGSLRRAGSRHPQILRRKRAE
jgi:chemotaxis response regulator CheB